VEDDSGEAGVLPGKDIVTSWDEGQWRGAVRTVFIRVICTTAAVGWTPSMKCPSCTNVGRMHVTRV
jgi:hypothetical protein